VIAEGPFGALTADRRRRPRAALIAGGVGVTPIRALIEDMPAAPGEVAVVFRARVPEDLVLREELEEIASRRGAELHVIVGAEQELSADAVRALVPDIAERDVYVCGPPGMTRATRRMLIRAGVPRQHIATEEFAL
jgi:ferredoxin-NADP reductase